MDILQWLKLDHEAMLRSVERLGDGNPDDRVVAAKGPIGKLVAELAFDLLGHLKAEEEYLLPELSQRFPGSDLIMDLCAANQSLMRKQVKLLIKASMGQDQEAMEGAVAGLRKAIQQHLEVQEMQLMPKLRLHVPTSEREDLGLLVQDMMEDLRGEGLDIAAELKSTSIRSKPASGGHARA